MDIFTQTHLGWGNLYFIIVQVPMKQPWMIMVNLNVIVHAQIKEDIKAPRHWLLCVECTGDLNSPHKRTVTRKKFPFDDVIMCCVHHSWDIPMWLNQATTQRGILKYKKAIHYSDSVQDFQHFGPRHLKTKYPERKCLHIESNFAEVCHSSI